MADPEQPPDDAVVDAHSGGNDGVKVAEAGRTTPSATSGHAPATDGASPVAAANEEVATETPAARDAPTESDRAPALALAPPDAEASANPPARRERPPAAGAAKPPPSSHFLCRFHRQGRCLYGDQCPYSHDLVNARLCTFHMDGMCHFGDGCRFLHGLPCPTCARPCLHPFNKAAADGLAGTQ